MRKPTHTASQRLARGAHRSSTLHPAGTKATRSATRQEYRAHQRLALALHGMSDGFIMLDRHWRCLRVNTAGARFFQKAPKDLFGQPIHKVLHAFNDRPLFAQLRLSMDRRVTLEFEEHRDPPGRWYAVRCLPSGPDLIVFFRDVTQLHTEAETDRNLLAQLRQAFAHDLTAPLRAQIGFAELLLRKHSKRLSTAGRDYVHRILEGAMRQADLIQTHAAQLQLARSLRRERGTITTQTTSVASVSHT